MNTIYAKDYADLVQLCKNGKVNAVHPRDLHKFLTNTKHRRVTDDDIIGEMRLVDIADGGADNVNIYDSTFNPLVMAIKNLACGWASPFLNDGKQGYLYAQTEVVAYFVTVDGEFYSKREPVIAKFLSDRGYSLGPEPEMTWEEHQKWFAHHADTQDEAITSKQAELLDDDDIIYTSRCGAYYGKIIPVKFDDLGRTWADKCYRAGSGAYMFSERAIRKAIGLAATRDSNS